MKKAMKLMIGLVVMVTALQVEAAGSLYVSADGDRNLKVEVSQLTGRASSYIQNSKGKVVYKKRVSAGENLQLAIDLSQLETGVYTFVVEDEVKFQSIPFEVTVEGVKLQEEKQVKTFFPTVTKSGQAIAVKLISDDTNDLYISIKTGGGKVLVEEKVEGQLGLIGKRYKFEPGKYSITLSSNEYSKTTFLAFE